MLTDGISSFTNTNGLVNSTGDSTSLVHVDQNSMTGDSVAAAHSWAMASGVSRLNDPWANDAENSENRYSYSIDQELGINNNSVPSNPNLPGRNVNFSNGRSVNVSRHFFNMDWGWNANSLVGLGNFDSDSISTGLNSASA